jgi:ATP-binding cassette subfamily F protein uup
VFWLDRGKLKVCPTGFAGFEDWSAMMLDQEARELQNRKSTVAIEVEWASRGVKARVKRNQARLEKAKQMRDQLKADQSAYRKATQKIQIKPMKDLEISSKVVAEFYNVHKHFESEGKITPILDKFSLRIIRGDRIGILGRNGSGKTTFLKMLIGEMLPDQGSVKRRKELEFSYFDQKRSDLNPTDSLRKTLCPAGGDHVDVMGKPRHVCGYLKDFMFDPARVQDKVSQLSGGQKNRLMLAKILANPKTCLILDEPTNDLDMDTLDMLEEILSAYTGTLIVVSHDRDFLDQTVTKILAFEGDGKVETYIGGYSDYMDIKAQEAAEQSAPKPAAPQKKQTTTPAPALEKQPLKKLTYKLEHELKQLPDKIQKTENEISECSALLADGDFYNRDPDLFHQTIKKLQDLKIKLERYENRWLEIEEMKTQP